MHINNVVFVVLALAHTWEYTTTCGRDVMKTILPKTNKAKTLHTKTRCQDHKLVSKPRPKITRPGVKITNLHSRTMHVPRSQSVQTNTLNITSSRPRPCTKITRKCQSKKQDLKYQAPRPVTRIANVNTESLNTKTT